MKKILITILLSIISTHSNAQTTNELEAKLQQLRAENQSLTIQNTSFDTKIQTKQKELSNTEKALQQLQTKRELSEQACKNISEGDLQLIKGLSGGTILLSGAGTLAGTLKNTTLNKEKNKSQEENSETAGNKSKLPSTSDKIINIATTVTSAGSTTTSAIALSKVEGLKSDIKKCLESFN